MDTLRLEDTLKQKIYTPTPTSRRKHTGVIGYKITCIFHNSQGVIRWTFDQSVPEYQRMTYFAFWLVTLVSVVVSGQWTGMMH